jgi:hypothetical protein
MCILRFHRTKLSFERKWLDNAFHVIKTTHVHHPVIGNAHVYMQLSNMNIVIHMFQDRNMFYLVLFLFFFYGTSSPILRPIIWILNFFDDKHFCNELKSV